MVHIIGVHGRGRKNNFKVKRPDVVLDEHRVGSRLETIRPLVCSFKLLNDIFHSIGDVAMNHVGATERDEFDFNFVIDVADK